ncbi:hypothetical protein EXT46_14900 [Pseudoalteromonas sp. CO325X]|uniref:hypothetical protein n=1 Tax=Pseudoalteromonas sp. CO325X TaxID=1777262 RepID=UPI001023208C|nr:hypothetical protein [Pseudoalteromonas sp. CO325X]RZF79178.1 hypothetical protein EXT46_14900 [Pseudoalteromonas sp. CO325X]
MDKLILGDNQFFGVNHKSESKSQQQLETFKSPEDIFNTLRIANDVGVKSFMFTTHDKLEPVFDLIKKNKNEFRDFKLIPCMPYAHKYADAMATEGVVGSVKKYMPRNIFKVGYRSLVSALTKDPVPIMKLLVDTEMRMMRGFDIEHVFLQNIVTDLVIGLGMQDVLVEFAEYAKRQYGAKAGFITLNQPLTEQKLIESGISKPLLCSSINKIGFRMNPSQPQVETCLTKKRSDNIAMSIFASGAINPTEAIEYIKNLEGVQSVLFGASSRRSIQSTYELMAR